MPATRFHIAVALVVACKQAPREDAPPVPDYTLEYHEPTTLADKQPGPSDVAVDETHVYWTHVGRPLVRRMPRAGGPIETVYEGTGELGGLWLALDADGVYFSDAFSIHRVAKTGGEAALVGVVTQFPARFAADTDAAYSASGTVARHPKLGAETRYTGAGGELWDIAVDATHVYWLSRGGVYRAPKGGGTPQELARGVFRWGKLALSETDVYWGDAVLDAIFAVQKIGGAPRVVRNGWSMATHDFVFDGARLFTLESGYLYAIDVATGAQTPFALSLQRGGSADHFEGIAVTPEAIYVAAGGQSLVGTGRGHIDLTKPNPQLPAFTYDGALLKLPAATPPKARSVPRGEMAIARVYFTGSEFQDPGNATRWIDDAGEAYELERGTLPLRIVASTSGITPQLALERAQKVEALVRAQLGAAVKITVETDAPTTIRGDVRILFDEAALLAHMTGR